MQGDNNSKKQFMISTVLLLLIFVLLSAYPLLKIYLYKEYKIEFRPDFIELLTRRGILLLILAISFFLISANRYFSVLENPPIKFDFYMNVGVIFIAFLLIISTLLYKSVFNREREDIVDDYYLAVYQVRPWDAMGEGMAKGEYEPLNSYIRKRITVDYGLEELLEHRYGLEFLIKKENGKTVIVPKDYPEYEFNLYDPFFYTLDIPDSLRKMEDETMDYD